VTIHYVHLYQPIMIGAKRETFLQTGERNPFTGLSLKFSHGLLEVRCAALGSKVILVPTSNIMAICCEDKEGASDEMVATIVKRGPGRPPKAGAA
jgi:hypothetical protein